LPLRAKQYGFQEKQNENIVTLQYIDLKQNCNQFNTNAAEYENMILFALTQWRPATAFTFELKVLAHDWCAREID